jgi:hypothetical protein
MRLHELLQPNAQLMEARRLRGSAGSSHAVAGRAHTACAPRGQGPVARAEAKHRGGSGRWRSHAVAAEDLGLPCSEVAGRERARERPEPSLDPVIGNLASSSHPIRTRHGRVGRLLHLRVADHVAVME